MKRLNARAEGLFDPAEIRLISKWSGLTHEPSASERSFT